MRNRQPINHFPQSTTTFATSIAREPRVVCKLKVTSSLGARETERPTVDWANRQARLWPGEENEIASHPARRFVGRR